MCVRTAAALAVAALVALASGSAVAARPKVTNRCPADALPIRRADLPALRRFGLALAQHGVERVGARTIDYRGARAKASLPPTFYTGYVRSSCPAADAKRVIARTADVLVSYPRVTWSASLAFSIFLVARTPRGLVGWAQVH